MFENYFVYILASQSKLVYVGVTNDLAQRLYEHKHKQPYGYTAQFNTDRLVYFETTLNINAAIVREK